MLGPRYSARVCPAPALLPRCAVSWRTFQRLEAGRAGSGILHAGWAARLARTMRTTNTAAITSNAIISNCHALAKPNATSTRQFQGRRRGGQWPRTAHAGLGGTAAPAQRAPVRAWRFASARRLRGRGLLIDRCCGSCRMNAHRQSARPPRPGRPCKTTMVATRQLQMFESHLMFLLVRTCTAVQRDPRRRQVEHFDPLKAYLFHHGLSVA